MDSLLNLLFPPECFLCATVGEVICDKCLAEMPLALSTNCVVCNKPTVTGKTHITCGDLYSPKEFLAIYQYKGPVRTVIRRSKYHQREFSLLRRLVKDGIKVIKDLGVTIEKGTVLVPIPISKGKLKERGFNQVEIITNLLAFEFGLETNKHVLQRVRNTKPQYAQSREERFANVRNAFVVKNEKKLKNRRILLVDDISTSGATLLEACKALNGKGICNINCWVVAKKQVSDKSLLK